MTTTAESLRAAKELIEAAYREGFKDGERHHAEGSTDSADEYWDYSAAKHETLWLAEREEADRA